MKGIIYSALISIAFLFSFPLFSQKTIVVNTDKSLADIQPTMWGIFFEDINFAADGGIYAELVKNRSFEFYKPLMGWTQIKKGDGKGKIYTLNRDELAANPRYVQIVSESESGAFGLANEGFRGMGIKKGMEYHFSMNARKQGTETIKVLIELLDSSGTVVGQTALTNFTKEWQSYKASLTSSATNPKGRLNVWIEGKGTLDVDMISLFPADTWKQRPNGMRADLVQLLADLKPGFIRFPGGCIVEGHDLSTRYQWKKTVGAIDERELIVNRWNTEFMHRHTPDYYQSFGLGFYEYFLLAEDLGAEPLPILNCGMACQYNTSELVQLDQLEPYIQDALDLIEFANGSPDTQWGKVRAEMGHPEPFNLKFLGIGNEQWGEEYVERYDKFASVIRKKYPNIKLVAGSGPGASGEQFDYLWTEFRKRPVDLMDEHYYRPPDWFLSNANRYDNYDRNGPKVFAGEYAAHGPQNDTASSRNTILSALAEAAFMTGLERNADIVQLCSYAPLLAHVDAWQWRPDLIWFDNLTSFGTPNYYVQKLFSNHAGTNVLPITENGAVISGQDSLYASSTKDEKANKIFVKLVNVSSKPMDINLRLDGKTLVGKQGKVTVLTSSNLLAYNSIDHPTAVLPVEKTIGISKSRLDYMLQPHSLTVLEFSIQQ